MLLQSKTMSAWGLDASKATSHGNAAGRVVARCMHWNTQLSAAACQAPFIVQGGRRSQPRSQRPNTASCWWWCGLQACGQNHFDARLTWAQTDSPGGSPPTPQLSSPNNPPVPSLWLRMESPHTSTLLTIDRLNCCDENRFSARAPTPPRWFLAEYLSTWNPGRIISRESWG